MHTLAARLTRQPLVAGLVLAGLVLPLAMMSAGMVNLGAKDLPYMLWALAFALPLVGAVSHPRPALVACAVPLAIQWVVTDGPMLADVVVLASLAFLAARVAWTELRWWVVGVIVVGAVAAIDWTVDAGQPLTDSGQLVGFLSGWLMLSGLVGAAVASGSLVRTQREQVEILGELAAALERDRRQAVELSTAQERTRIATDMHDVLAHSLAVIAVQTDAARLILSSDTNRPVDPRALTAVDAAHAASVQALRETRQLVGTLTDPSSSRDPQPMLADIPALITRMDPSGRRVSLVADLDLSAVGLGAAAQLAVHRIVQEALTNVIRHAGPHARATVTLRLVDGGNSPEVEASIVDDGIGPGANDGAGHGLSNMAQRAGSVGGTVTTEAPPNGGFAVVAHIPLAGKEAPCD